MVTVETTIKEIGADALEASVDIIRSAFGVVADEMGLTEDNASVYPAFTTIPRLKELLEKCDVFFGMFSGARQVGFVAIEKEGDDVYKMRRLAVLPELWHAGLGRRLADFAIDYVRKRGGRKLEIALVNEQSVLKDWYKNMGFHEVLVKRYKGLPFSVCFMEMEISGPGTKR
jgi:GNAT superfamily N-acetyltransferase